MQPFTPKTFTIPELKGISKKTIEEHIKLYEGYVKNANDILAKIPEYQQWTEKDPFVTYFTNELMRRFSFEWNGMKNHEKYFALLEGGATAANNDSSLAKAIVSTWGSMDTFLAKFKSLAMTRGIGWAMLSKDHSDNLLMHWVDEQHLGQLQDTTPIIALDVWEHSYVMDYAPSGKKQYIEDFFINLNWSIAEKNFE